MSGWIVVPLTVVAIAIFIYAVAASESILNAMVEYYSKQKTGTQILLLIPLALVAIWHLLAAIIATLLGLFAGYSIFKFLTGDDENK